MTGADIPFDNDTDTSLELVRALESCGWKTVIWRFPTLCSEAVAYTLPAGCTHPRDIAQVTVPNFEETTLVQYLASVVDAYGQVGAFVHLSPVCYRNDGTLFGSGDVVDEAAMAILKHIFLLAKHLQPMLTDPMVGRASFMTVMRLDGRLGLGAGTAGSAVEGGFFGLTKTLALEWPGVFCRAVDICSELDVPSAVQAILAELHDPNRLITEVGINAAGRVTLTAE